jgi:hypothetical protein
MRAIHINSDFFDLPVAIPEIEDEFSGALLAGDALAQKFAIDAQFPAAVGAADIVSPQCELDSRLNLLERNEFRNFDAVGLEIGIEERPAIAAMDELFGHFFAAFRAWTARPWWH